MEGRKALPKTSIPAMVAKRMETFPGDRSHRQVIEAIRAGNNDEFFESMETGFDVNFMDDVGQTLLNWAAAFGTYEMVHHTKLVVCVVLTTFTYSYLCQHHINYQPLCTLHCECMECDCSSLAQVAAC